MLPIGTPVFSDENFNVSGGVRSEVPVLSSGHPTALTIASYGVKLTFSTMFFYSTSENGLESFKYLKLSSCVWRPSPRHGRVLGCAHVSD